MLDIMRKHAKSWVINILIAAIVVVFIFWGVGSFRQKELTKAATVNGEPIPIAEFQQAYQQMLEMARNQYREYLTDELLEAMNLKQQALDRLINEHLIFQQARHLGVDVTDAQLQQTIAATPAFQVDGAFNLQRYRSMLARSRFTEKDYEQIVRRDLLAQKVIRLITAMAKVADGEVKDAFHFYNDKIDLEFALVAPEAFRDQVKPTDAQVNEYFGKNQEKYRIPPKVKAAYLAFRADAFMDQVQVAEDELAEYYELNLDKYREPEMVQARHILFRLDQNASPEDVAKVQAKAETVLQQAQGDDFAKLAEQYSEGPTAKNGGDLGWFAKDQMVEAFADAAFALEKGQISELVRSDFGFHIIKLEDRRPARNRPFEEAREEIRNKLLKERASELALDKAMDAYDEASVTKDLEAVAKKMNMTVQTTGFFSANESLIDSGLEPKFNEVALSLQKGEVGPLTDMEDGHYLIKVVDAKESAIPKLDEVYAAVQEDLIHETSMNLAQQAAKDFLANVKAPEEWTKLNAEAGRTVDSTGLFTRGEAVPKIGNNQALKSAAFNLKTVGDMGSEPYEDQKGYYVIRLKASVPATDDEFAAKKEQIRQSLINGKGQAYLYQWLEDLKAKAIIEIDNRVL